MSICIFGDSITWGANDLEKGGWVERLKIYILEKYDVSVYNLGISGDTTHEVLQRIGVELKAPDPQVVVFAIGINDSQYLRNEKTIRVPIEKFKEKIHALYTIAVRFSEKIVAEGPFSNSRE